MSEETFVNSIREMGHNLQGFFGGKLTDFGGYLWSVALALIFFCIGVKVIRWITKKTDEYLRKTNLNQAMVQFFTSMAKYSGYAALVFLIANSCGVSASSVATLIGTAGVTIGLALQGGLTNITGGIMILLFHPFQLNDYIIVDGTKEYEGFVKKMDIYYTTLSSIDNRSIVIPNGVLSSNTIINVTAKDLRRLEWFCGITYDADIKKAKKTLEKLLKNHKSIRNKQDIQVFVSELTDSSVTIGFRAWVDTSEYLKMKWELTEEIKHAFDAAGIPFAFNQLDVHLYPNKEN